MRRVRTLVLATIASGFGFAALAQTPVQQPRDPNMPAPQTIIPEKVAPDDPTTTGSTNSGTNLSRKLNQSDGVIKPRPGIDPEMAAPTPNPDAGAMPIIPPPGSPGGNQAIEPK
jgi:hypothetical protein